MPDLFEPTLADQIACVRREIGMREHVYPRRVSDGKMGQANRRSRTRNHARGAEDAGAAAKPYWMRRWRYEHTKLPHGRRRLSPRPNRRQQNRDRPIKSRHAMASSGLGCARPSLDRNSRGAETMTRSELLEAVAQAASEFFNSLRNVTLVGHEASKASDLVHAIVALDTPPAETANDGQKRPKAGFDVGYGPLKEGDDCILVAEGNMPSGPAKLLTVYQDGDAQIELCRTLTVKWRFLRPLPPPPAPREGEGA